MLWFKFAVQYCKKALHFTVLDFSFPSYVKICTSCRPCWPNQVFITGTLSSSESLYALVSWIFQTSISKFLGSRNLSCTSQLNTGFVSIDWLCLCLCGCLWLTMVIGWGPASVSHSAIITTMTTWTTTWFTTFLIFSDSALFSFFSQYIF